MENKIIERINGAKIITTAFQETPDKDGNLGHIDFVDERFDEKPRHRFAYIAAKDWIQKKADGTVSQFETITGKLTNALKEDCKINIVLERRQATPEQQFDYLVKVDDVSAFTE